MASVLDGLTGLTAPTVSFVGTGTADVLPPLSAGTYTQRLPSLSGTLLLGAGAFTNHGLIVGGATTGALNSTAAGLVGQILAGAGAGADPAWSSNPTLGIAGVTGGSLAIAGSGSGTVTVDVAATAGTWTLTLPTSGGTNGYVLTTNGSGVTSWTAVSSSGTVNSGSTNQLTYYSSNGTTVSGNANATISSGALTLGVAGSAAGSLVLSGATSQTVTIKTAATAGGWNLTLPTSGGTNGYVLTTDGSGVTSWAAASGSGTVNSGTANELAFYSTTGTAVSGNANVTVSTGALTLGVAGTAAGSLLLSGSGSGKVTINTAAAAGTWSLTLPTTGGTNGYFLQTNGSGVTTWAVPTSTPGGATTQVQYNNAGAFAGAASFTFNGTGALTLGVASATAGTINLYNSSSANAVTIASGNNASAWSFTLPNDPGTNGYALTTNGSGTTAWTAVGSGTVNSGTANQMAFYSSTGTAVSGNANVTVSTGALTLGVTGAAAGSLLLSGSSSGKVTIGTAAAAGSWTFTLPATGGTSGQFLQTDGSGVTTWATAGNITVNTTPLNGGTSGRVLYDNAGTVGELAVTGSGNAVLATSPTIVTGTYTGLNETQTTVGTGAITINCAAGNVFQTTLSANITGITFTNVPASGTAYSLTLSVTAGGSFTITWPASVKWPGGTAPTLTTTAGKVDTFVLYTFNGGTTWYAFNAGQNA